MTGEAWRQIWALGLILLLALALRLAAVSVLGALPEKDALEYHTIAINLATGYGYALQPDEPTSLRPPAYPLFLAAVYAVSGPDYRHVLYLQALLNALLVIPLFWLARRMSGSVAVGMFAAGLFAVHTSFEVVSRLYAENLLIPLALGFVGALYMALRRPESGWGWSVAGGVAAGLMGLAKPEMGLLGIALFMLALLAPATRMHWRRLAVVALVSMLMIGAWQGRNLVVGSYGQGDLAGSALLFSYYPAITGSWWWPVTDMQALEGVRRQADDYLASHDHAQMKQALETAIAGHPFDFVKLAASRVMILWASPPVGSTVLASVSPMLRWLALLAQYLFVAIAWGALLYFAAIHKARILPMLALALYMTVVYGLVHAIRRYGYTFVPEFCLLVAWGGWMLWHGREGSERGDG